MIMKTKVSQSNKKIIILLTILSFLVCSFVFADGDSRQATQAEKDFSKSILNTFAKVVPPGPEGWEKTGDSTEITELRTVYSEEKEPLRLEYRIAWQNTKQIMDGEMKFSEELQKLAKKSDFNGKLPDEVLKLRKPKDVKVQIVILTNRSSEGLYNKAKPAPAIAGGLVYRSQESYEDWREGTTHIFLGKKWKAGHSSSTVTYIDFKPEKSITSSTVVQNIYVKVQADPKRVEQIIQKIDWEALKKLINN